ncbi:hypothetical protein SUGI_1051650 [Cryptomeria japonica]|uniref:L-gulonolactone oxidase 5 n=1 Tax=Cryptomeria japonica TaxID=3369 RepID=UPI0024148C41|nr:L-gulonolactone oxidase 5 [Cryptomeria japonica]GLJ49583.1 hypothetical protein SUGI_1051650 [Cryptomeria japonica]
MERLRSTILVAILLCKISLACVPPPSVECNGGRCEIFNYQGIWDDLSSCKAGRAFFPNTEPELLQAVRFAVKMGKKIRVVSRFSHSLSKLVCQDKEGVIISTANYDSKIQVNKSAMTITVAAGVMMRDVIDAAAKEGLALPHMIYWDGVSAAGVLSTGAHGSGVFGKGSAVHEYVRALTIVVPTTPAQGYAKLVSVAQGDERFNGVRLSLGVLGAISEITFGLEPIFKRSVSYSLEEDVGMEERIVGFVKKYEFGDVWWYPAHGEVIWGAIDRVSGDVDGDGVNKMEQLGQPSTVSNAEDSGTTLNTIESTQDTKLLCNLTGQIMTARVSTGAGFLNSESQGFVKYPVIGWNNRMQATGGCQDYFHKQEPNPKICTPHKILDKNESICSWDRRVDGVRGFDVEIYVPLKNAKHAIMDVKKIRDLNPHALCELEFLEGMSMRSVKKSEAYLGHSEDVITFEFEYLRKEQWEEPKWNMDVYEEIEQMLVEKYGGTPHWGKSGGFLFQGVANKTLDLPKFLKVKEEMDPTGLFSIDWTDAILGIGGKQVQVFRDGCGLHKMCKCKEDRHCLPHKGYFCRPGRVWKNARVCRKD